MKEEMKDSINFKDTEIKKLFYKFLLPTVLGMIFSAIFIITDGIFVGKGIGSDALAAVNMIAPLYMIATGIGLMFGMGGSVVASVNLARGKEKVANINITQAALIPSVVVLIVSILLIVFRKGVLLLLGTPEELMVLADEYLYYLMPFLAPVAFYNILMFLVRLDGAPKFAMACNIVAAILNIALDYIFIFIFNWGLMGAAVATGVGIVVGVIMMLVYLFFYNKTLHFLKIKLSRKSILLTLRNLGYMIQIGFSTFISELAISCMMIVGNYTFIQYLGKDGVAAYSIACYIEPIIFMVFNGIIQSAQPIISYNHGINNKERVRETLRLALRASVVCGVLFFVITSLFRHQIVGLFLHVDAPAYTMATYGLPYFAFGCIFFGINVVVAGYLQSIEEGKWAAIFTVLRGIVLMSASFILLPKFLGVLGIWNAISLAEILGTIIVIILLFKVKSKKPNLSTSQNS